MGSRSARAAVGLVAVIGTAALSVPGASANYHLMKISEVYPGTALAPDRAFVELQMPAAGQNQVSGHEIVVYDPVGAVNATVPITGNVPNGQSQRTILLGDIDVTNRDFPANIGTLVEPAGGAVCFPDGSPPDCVAWGTFTGAASLPGAVGTPEPGTIPDGSSLTRTITRGCPTALDAADDTNNSSADLAVTTPATPRNNAATPTERTCAALDTAAPDSQIDKGPKKKVKTKKKKKKVEFVFSSADPTATFECSLDDAEFEACTSPEKVKVKAKRKAKKHSFAVRAKDAAGNVDQTPDELKFKLKRK